MGFAEILAQMNAAQAAAFGETIAYTPAGTGVAFDCAAILGSTFRDEFEAGDTRLKRECRVLCSTLQDNGVDEPVDQVRGNPADTVTLTGPSGESEIWTVTGKEYSMGLWILTLSRNIRVKP